ncbi:hypothetical protein DIPPA_23431 [Diplonema papillatum]|nr:hypothetical protein DIPPA_23431 [Diplonema papillatum]
MSKLNSSEGVLVVCVCIGGAIIIFVLLSWFMEKARKHRELIRSAHGRIGKKGPRPVIASDIPRAQVPVTAFKSNPEGYYPQNPLPASLVLPPSPVRLPASSVPYVGKHPDGPVFEGQPTIIITT